MKSKFLYLALILVLLTACSPRITEVTATPRPSSTGDLVLYTGPSATVTLTPTPADTPTPLPTPTPTPRTHTVSKGEDMFGIALRYGIPLEQLLTANPTVDPYWLSVGAVLVVPAPLNTPTPDPDSPPLPTPLPMTVEKPVCYPSGDGGLWCFALVSNPLAGTSEAVSVTIRLHDRDSGEIRSQVVSPFLNQLIPDSSLPLAVYFSAPTPTVFDTSAELITALPLATDSGRYLALQPVDPQVEIATDGRTAAVSGSLQLVSAESSASRVAVTVVAYDSTGRISGVRNWESLEPLEAGGQVEFTLLVYAAGDGIARVEVLAEALP